MRSAGDILPRLIQFVCLFMRSLWDVFLLHSRALSANILQIQLNPLGWVLNSHRQSCFALSVLSVCVLCSSLHILIPFLSPTRRKAFIQLSPLHRACFFHVSPPPTADIMRAFKIWCPPPYRSLSKRCQK